MKSEIWLARDPNGELFLYLGSPKRATQYGEVQWGNHLHCKCLGELPSELFPQVKKNKKTKLVIDSDSTAVMAGR